MVEARIIWRQAKEPVAPPDPFADIEAERLNQEIARQYVLLAEALGGPFRGNRMPVLVPQSSRIRVGTPFGHNPLGSVSAPEEAQGADRRSADE
jgi:hypothetical protein